MWAHFYETEQDDAHWEARALELRSRWQKGEGRSNTDIDSWLPRVLTEWARRKAQKQYGQGDLDGAFDTILLCDNVLAAFDIDRVGEPVVWPTEAEQQRYDAFRSRLAGMYADVITTNRMHRTELASLAHVAQVTATALPGVEPSGLHAAWQAFVERAMDEDAPPLTEAEFAAMFAPLAEDPMLYARASASV